MIYLVIAIVCIVLLVVMAALGGFGGDVDAGHGLDIGGHDVDVGGTDADLGHYDAGHGDYSGSTLNPLSVPVLLAFGATFGAVGAIMEELNVDSMLTVLVAVVIGVVVAGGMYGLVYVMIVKSQSSTHIHSSDLIGLEGILTVGIKNREPGSVVVNHEKRGRVPLSATAGEDIETNTPVKIVKVAGDAVIVERINGAGAAQQRKEG